MDSVTAIANLAVNISLSGLENGTYWLYARDETGNISDPKAFTITSVGNDNTFAFHVKIFPNPAKFLLSIETELPELHTVEITSLNGHLIYSQNFDGSTLQIDLSTFQKGVYFITLRSKNFEMTEKIIKM